MNFEERLQLLMQAKLNGVKLKQCAEHLGCSVSWLSQYFHNKCEISTEHQEQLIRFINSYSNK